MNAGLLVETLKKELKKRGLTYKSLADKLKLSEAAVKRLFAERNFSLKRLDEICAAAEIDLSHLMRAAAQVQSSTILLPIAAEDALAADPKLLLIWYALVLGGLPKAVRTRFGVEKTQFYQMTREMERLGLLEVLPKERLLFKIPKSARWRADGPLIRRYGAAVREEFFASDFSRVSEKQDFLTGALTIESFTILKRKIEALFQEFEQLSELDSRILDHKTEVFWFYTGIRPWAPVAVVQRAPVG